MTDSGSAKSKAVSEALKLATTDGVSGIIGGYVSTATQVIALALNRYHIFQCSGSATLSDLSLKSDYPNFFRTIPSDAYQGRALAKYVHSMGWRQAAILAGNDAYSLSISQTFASTAESELNMTITTNQVYLANATNYTVNVQAVKQSGSRIIMLFGFDQDAIKILREARKQGIVGPDYVWIGSEGIYSIIEFMNNPNETYTVEDRENLRGMLIPFPNERPSYTRKHAEFIQRLGREPEPYVLFFKDCLTSMVRGIINVASSGKNVTDPSVSLKDFLTPFAGVTGNVTWDDKGDRAGEYIMYNIQKNGTTYARKRVSLITDSRVIPISTPLFYSQTPTIPPDSAILRPDYPVFSMPGVIVILVLYINAFIVIVGTCFYLYRKRQTPQVRHMSLLFVLLIATGLILLGCSILTWIDIPTEMTCIFKLYLFNAGYAVLMGSLLMKTWRIFKIFDSSCVIKSRLGDKKLLIGVAGIVGVELLLVTIWTVLSPPKPTKFYKPEFYSYKCVSSDQTVELLMNILVIAYNGILLFFASVLAFKTRKVYSQFRESVYIMYSVSNIILSGIIVIPILFFLSDVMPTGTFYIKTLGVYYGGAFVYFLLIGRIAIQIYSASTRRPYKVPMLRGLTNVKVMDGFFDSLGNDKEEEVSLSSSGCVLRGTFPVKECSLFGTWRKTKLMVLQISGEYYLTMARMKASSQKEMKSGSIHKLSTIMLNPQLTISSTLPLSTTNTNTDTTTTLAPPSPDSSRPPTVQLLISNYLYVIQFPNESTKSSWLKTLTPVCPPLNKTKTSIFANPFSSKSRNKDEDPPINLNGYNTDSQVTLTTHENGDTDTPRIPKRKGSIIPLPIQIINQSATASLPSPIKITKPVTTSQRNPVDTQFENLQYQQILQQQIQQQGQGQGQGQRSVRIRQHQSRESVAPQNVITFHLPPPPRRNDSLNRNVTNGVIPILPNVDCDLTDTDNKKDSQGEQN
ncbi:periplasmic binding protein-like I [Paraphysoderma sedebokerense]|nr:periplasmic binding protein-like I [Paraphysoderma sedebokerense]